MSAPSLHRESTDSLIVDITNNPNNPPCVPLHGASDRTLISYSSVPASFKLTYTPFYEYGACETAQKGGYLNTATFDNQIDTTKPLFLRVYREDDAREEIFFHYFTVEMF